MRVSGSIRSLLGRCGATYSHDGKKRLNFPPLLTISAPPLRNLERFGAICFALGTDLIFVTPYRWAQR